MLLREKALPDGGVFFGAQSVGRICGFMPDPKGFFDAINEHISYPDKLASHLSVQDGHYASVIETPGATYLIADALWAAADLLR